MLLALPASFQPGLNAELLLDSLDTQQEIIQQKMQLAIATDPDSYAANAALARVFASKQSGAAVNYMFSAGYGYEEPAKSSSGVAFEVRAPWD